MGAAVDYLRVNGFFAEKRKDRVIVSPASKLTPEIRAFIKANRPSLLAELAANDGQERRGNWRVVVDGKRMTMVGEPCTYDEALAAAQWRWSSAGIEL